MAAGYQTKHVLFFRSFLPVLAGIGLVAVIALPLYNDIQQKLRSKYSATHLKADEIALTLPQGGQPAKLQMSKPEFTGFDEQKRPYKIVADHVIQDVTAPNTAPNAAPNAAMKGTMQLQNPVAILTMNRTTGETVSLSSRDGVYDPNKQTLQLNKHVTLIDSRGFTLHMQDLFIDLVQGLSKTDLPVAGEGPMGVLSGQSMELRDKGDHIILHGRSKVILTPQSKEIQE